MVTVILRLTDTIRPHADYGSGLNPDCLQRLVTILLRSRHKTQCRQSGFLTPTPCMESEPPRHFPFVTAHGGKECVDAALSASYRSVIATYIALSGADNIVSDEI